jgi:hypothetical protein
VPRSTVDRSVSSSIAGGGTVLNWRLVRAAVVTTAALIITCSTVAPLRPAAAEEIVSVVPTPNSGRPGDSITVSFSSNSPNWMIDGCSAGFTGGTSVLCAAPATTVTVRVPDTAEPGSIVLAWGASYRSVFPPQAATGNGGSGSADGSIPFTVLPPEPSVSPSAEPVTPSPSTGAVGGGGGGATTASPTGGASAAPQPAPTSGASASEHQGLPVVPLVLGLLLLAGLATAFLVRRSRRAAPNHRPPGEHVRAVARPGPVRVTVRTTRGGVTVRLLPRAGHPSVHVQEV